MNAKMVIKVKSGRVTQWQIKGDINEQIKNIDALVSQLQRTAAAMKRVANRATGIDPVLEAENGILKESLKSEQAKTKTQSRVIEAADRALKQKRGVAAGA